MAACPADPPNPADVEALYPANSVPQVRLDQLSALCSYGVTPVVMTGALRQILIQHYSVASNILNYGLRQQLTAGGMWKNDNTTAITIEAVETWKPEMTEYRPGLVIKGNDWDYVQFAVGNHAETDYRTGARSFVMRVTGSHTIFAVHQTATAAQQVAIETFKCLQYFAPEILQQLSLQRFTPARIHATGSLKESNTHFVTPVTVQYVFEDRWTLTPEAPRVKQIIFRASETLQNY